MAKDKFDSPTNPEVTTYSEENGIFFHNSLASAMEHARDDETVRKISFSLPNNERVCLIRSRGKWVYEAIEGK